MKLFQIEEPDGSPVDPDAPGVAVGIDLGGAQAEVAIAVGGNAVLLHDREGFELDLTIPSPVALGDEWGDLLEGARLRAERALAQPVTHAVLALATKAEPGMVERLREAAAAAGLALLDVVMLDGGDHPGKPRACTAAILAEDLAPRPVGS